MKRYLWNRRLIVVTWGRRANRPFLVEAPAAPSAVRLPSPAKKPVLPSDFNELPPAA
jgi:hypothetical protein